MQAVEFAVLNWIQSNLRCAFLDKVLPLASGLCDHGEVWILLALLLLSVRRTRRQGAAVSCGLALDLVACNLLLKPLFDRIRPFALTPSVVLLIKPPLDASFPSGHTAASFAAVFALKAAGSPLWKPSLVLATVIAFSRMYLYVHWPSDVLGGALLGAFVGWAGAKLAEGIGRRVCSFGKKR
mgnify:CR=1 FL=1